MGCDVCSFEHWFILDLAKENNKYSLCSDWILFGIEIRLQEHLQPIDYFELSKCSFGRSSKKLVSQICLSLQHFLHSSNGTHTSVPISFFSPFFAQPRPSPITDAPRQHGRACDSWRLTSSMAASGSRRQPATWVGSGDVNVPHRFPRAVGGRAGRQIWRRCWRRRKSAATVTTLLLLALMRGGGDAVGCGYSRRQGGSGRAGGWIWWRRRWQWKLASAAEIGDDNDVVTTAAHTIEM